MADAKISALPSATSPLAGTEVLPIVQGGVTDKVTAADMLRQAGQTVTTSNPVLSLAQTWNNGAVTFTGLLFNATNTASAAASMLMDLQVGGTSQFNVTRAGAVSATSGFAAGVKALIDIGVPGLSLSSESTIAWSSTTSYFNTKDLILVREAANILGQRNTTAAQAFRLYNTYTDISNYERLNLAFSGNVAYLITQQGGTGVVRNMVLGTQGLATVEIITNNASRWSWTGASGHFLASTDNATDIGASGANRPRDIYAANSLNSGNTIVAGGAIVAGAYVVAGSSWYLGWSGRSSMYSPSDGVMTITNNAGSDFTRLQFGGTTSSFPSLKRSTTALHVRLADDSAFANLAANEGDFTGRVAAFSATAIPAGGTAGAGLRVSSTSNFGVFFGSGAPTLSAAKGSLYLRSDGSGTGDRMYVNTDGATAWTAVTTAT